MAGALCCALADVLKHTKPMHVAAESHHATTLRVNVKLIFTIALSERKTVGLPVHGWRRGVSSQLVEQKRARRR